MQITHFAFTNVKAVSKERVEEVQRILDPWMSPAAAYADRGACLSVSLPLSTHQAYNLSHTDNTLIHTHTLSSLSFCLIISHRRACRHSRTHDLLMCSMLVLFVWSCG